MTCFLLCLIRVLSVSVSEVSLNPWVHDIFEGLQGKSRAEAC